LLLTHRSRHHSITAKIKAPDDDNVGSDRVAVVNKAVRTATGTNVMVPLAAPTTTTIPTLLLPTLSSSGAFIFAVME